MSYGKIITRGLFSENSDYSFPSVDTKTDECPLTPTLVASGLLSLSTSAETLSLSGFSSISAVVLVNRSSTAAESIKASWNAYLMAIQAAAAPNDVGFANPEDFIKPAPSADLTTRGIPLVGTVVVSSAENGNNDGTFPFILGNDGATNNMMQLQDGSVGTNNGSDSAALLEIYGSNHQLLPARGQLVITSAILISSGITLVASSGTPLLEYFVLGT